MNPTNIFNLKRKKILVLVMSFIPKKRILQIIKKNKRLQKLLKISPTLYEIYSLKNVNHPFTYKLQNYGNDEFLKKELLFSLFEIANLQFFENIGFEIKNTNKDSHKKRISNIVKLPSFIDNDVLIASFSWDNSLKIWNLTKKTLQVNFTLPIDDIIIQVIPLYDKKIVADKKKPIKIMIITWDKDIIIYNLRNNEVFATRKIEQAGKLITAIRVNRLLCTSSYENEIRIWNIDEILKKYSCVFDDYDTPIEPIKIRCLNILNEHKGPISCLIPLKDGRIASGSWDTKIKIWNLITYSCDCTLDNLDDKIIYMIQLFDERIGAVTLDANGYILNIKNKTVELNFEAHDYLYQIKDGRIITGMNEGEFMLFNLDNQKIEMRFKTNHKDKISGFLQLSDGKFVTSSFDKTIKVYGFVNKKEKSEDAEDYSFTYDNNCLYITYEGN